MADNNDNKNRSEYFEDRAGTEDARFHMVPHGDGEWAIKREGEDDPVETYNDRDKAIDDTIKKAKDAGTIAIIHNDDGQIERQENFEFDEDDDKNN